MKKLLIVTDNFPPCVGLFRLRHAVRNFSFFVDVSLKKKLPKEHFWEVGCSKETQAGELVKIISKYYSQISKKKYFLNPYHLSITAVR